MNIKPDRGIFVLLILLLCNWNVSHAKKMYRWIDENGNVFFSDQVPPDQVQHKRETLNEKARVLDKVEKAKTAEELLQQKRLEALRQEQEKVIARQAASDKVLLATYRSFDDIKKALINKLALLDGEKKVLEGNKQQFERQLLLQQQQAATLERNGQHIPEKLLKEIASSRQQIDFAMLELQHHEVKRQEMEKTFKADIDRFAFLIQGLEGGKAPQNSQAANNNNALGLFVCENGEQCEKAWKVAGEFVYKFATTGRDVETDQLIMTAAPANDNDMSLSVSKLVQGNLQQIFLDIRCKSSNIGQEMCAGEKALNIRQSFAPYIQLQLTPQQ